MTVLANFLILAGLRSSHSIAVYIRSIFTAICGLLNSGWRPEHGCNELGEAVIRVCLRGVLTPWCFVLFVGFRGDVPRLLDLCVAYVMNSARDRKDSPEGCPVRIVLKASRKYPKLSEWKVSFLRASTHFFVIPDIRLIIPSMPGCGTLISRCRALTHLREPFHVEEMVLAVGSEHHKLLVIESLGRQAGIAPKIGINK